MTTSIESADYRPREEALEADPVIQRMAVDLRQSGQPKSDFAHENGTPRHEFIGRANDSHRTMSVWSGPLHLGAVATVVLYLAFDGPVLEFAVRPGTDGYEHKYVITAINQHELGLRLRALVALTADEDRRQMEVHLDGMAHGVATVTHQDGRKLFEATFDMTGYTDQQGR